MIKKIITKSLKNMSVLSSIGMRLVKLTGKSDNAIHPKHLIKSNNPWYISQIKKNDTVLDVGCGIGQDAIRCAKHAQSVVAIDIRHEDIEIAKKLASKAEIANIKFIVFDAEKKLPFPKQSFSKVLVFDVLEHITEGEKLIHEAKRVLKEGGKILLLTDNPQTSWKKFQKSAGIFYYADVDHKHEYSKDEIIKLLKDNNFDVISLLPDTYDTPLKPIIDLIGGFSLTLYSHLSKWRRKKAVKNPNETTGYRIVAQLCKS